MTVGTVLGTVRPGSYTGKALALVEDELRRLGTGVDSIDPAALQLSFPGAGTTPDAEDLRRRIGAATAVVLATPEYHGSFSSVLKLVIENLGFPSALAGKPVALLGVAAGRIGAIKSLEQLRGVCSHVGCVVMPGVVSVAGVQKAFASDGRCLDPGVERMVRSVATGLIDYVQQAVCPRLTLEAMVRGEIDLAELAAGSRE